MADAVICPWCQMEIVWDEEVGPEEECPHCLGPLTDYRSVTLSGEEVEEGEAEEPAADSGMPEDGWQDDMVRETGPSVPDVKAEVWERYRDAVDAIRDNQLEAPECGQCRDLMVLVGEQAVASDRFSPVSDMLKPFLQAPYKLRVHVCPSCFHVAYSLSEEDRLAAVQRLGERQ